MYSSLLAIHSLFRWLVLLSLLYAIGSAYQGYSKNRAFTKTDDSIRHWTATIAHIQLIIGFTLYLISPLIRVFLNTVKQSTGQLVFFGFAHIGLMLAALVVITISSASAKRRLTSQEKFRTMLVWFSIGLAIILLAIPWPFSPFANRPYIRPF